MQRAARCLGMRAPSLSYHLVRHSALITMLFSQGCPGISVELHTLKKKSSSRISGIATGSSRPSSPRIGCIISDRAPLPGIRY